jgi:nitrogen fixation protein NifU and related proteins
MDLKELYRDVILDHNRKPRNFGVLPPPARLAHGHNPLCGDELTVYARLAGERIEDLAFEGRGCAISVAAASLMSEAVKGKTLAEAERLYEDVHALLTGRDPVVPPSLGKLAALSGVREFPVRVKCASLAWHTLKAALESADTPAAVSTE